MSQRFNSSQNMNNNNNISNHQYTQTQQEYYNAFKDLHHHFQALVVNFRKLSDQKTEHYNKLVADLQAQIEACLQDETAQSRIPSLHFELTEVLNSSLKNLSFLRIQIESIEDEKTKLEEMQKRRWENTQNRKRERNGMTESQNITAQNMTASKNLDHIRVKKEMIEKRQKLYHEEDD